MNPNYARIGGRLGQLFLLLLIAGIVYGIMWLGTSSIPLPLAATGIIVGSVLAALISILVSNINDNI